MNKYILLGMLFGFLYLMAIIANSIELEASELHGSPISQPETSVDSIWGTLVSFWNMVTFQIEGVPFFITMIFLIISIVLVYMIIDILKDLVPFT